MLSIIQPTNNDMDVLLQQVAQLQDSVWIYYLENAGYNHQLIPVQSNWNLQLNWT